jgi:hypothetical protein
MHSSHSRLVTTIMVGTLIAAACTSTAAPTPDVTPTASPSTTITPAAASPIEVPSPSPTATPVSPSPSATPQATAAPTSVPVPPKPTGVKFHQKVRVTEGEDESVAKVTQTVTWRAPRGKGVEIRVYGVTKCIAEPADPAPGTSGPCLVTHTPLPASVRTLLGTAPASDGVVSWTWTQVAGECGEPLVFYDPDGPAYHAVVLAAYGTSGHSIFAIVEPGGWWRPDLGDIIC